MHNLAELVAQAARRTPDAEAFVSGDSRLSYQALVARSRAFAARLQALDIPRGERIAIFLDKRIETVVSMLGAAASGHVFVPVNPLLKPDQVAHILTDCGAQCLVTSPLRTQLLGAHPLAGLRHLILVEEPGAAASLPQAGAACHSWPVHDASGDPGEPASDANGPARYPGVDTDLAAILYTSGSTGLPKGVMLSHRNLLEGAWSVSPYLGHTASERILAALPLSFDAGLSQLTTAWAAGATVVLVNYLIPQDIIALCQRERITGLTGVPPLWMQLARAAWPEPARTGLRYFANTGGHLPRPVLCALRELFPPAKPYLLYGLTEAFSSTFLEPAE